MPKPQTTLKNWCLSNGYDGVSKECLLSAFNSQDELIHKLAKQEKLKGVLNGKKEKR